MFADVVLVLADADGFRVDLHKFGERILQAPRDGDRTADRDVEIGQFGAGVSGGGIDRRACFRHHGLGEFEVCVACHQVCGELVGFARGRAVADGDEIDFVGAGKARENRDRFVPAVLRLVRIDRLVGYDFAGGINNRDFDAGAEARIEAHRRACACGRGKQEIAQISGEDFCGFVLGELAQTHP